MLDLIPEVFGKTELDLESDTVQDRTKLMTTVDGLKRRFGKGRCRWQVLTSLTVTLIGERVRSG